MVIAAALLLLGEAILGVSLILMGVRRLPLFFPGRRRLYAWRKRLAAFLSVRNGLAPGGLAHLLEDDGHMGMVLQRFLAAHHVPYPLPLYDTEGRYLFTAPTKVPLLAQALLRAVSTSHPSRVTRTGFASVGASSWMPPESVTIICARIISATKER